jgi:hypothetical protein
MIIFIYRKVFIQEPQDVHTSSVHTKHASRAVEYVHTASLDSIFGCVVLLLLL